MRPSGPQHWEYIWTRLSPEELEDVRLSSKSHWDVPIEIGDETVHFLVSHPTPPTFDGPEDRNGPRNHDEIRFWADYVAPSDRRAAYVYDDHGPVPRPNKRGGTSFVIAGDQNADPADGDSVDSAIDQLLRPAGPRAHAAPPPRAAPRPRTTTGRREHWATRATRRSGHRGLPGRGAPGNLRVDYVLPSRGTKEIVGSGIFWPVGRRPAVPPDR